VNIEAIIAGLDFSTVSLAILVSMVTIAVMTWHATKDGFDVSDCLLDTTTRKVSPEKVGYMTVLLMMSWALAVQVMKGQLTEWYAGLYGGLFVLGRIGYKYVDAKKDPNVAQPTTQP
jgi:hypothetical protein